jgi:RNA polymerase sigma factor (TIGR02999 family)
MTSAPTVTTLLQDWRSGDADALDQLVPLIYDDLRRIAASHMRTERSGHTLQATALVNEAFARLAEANASFQNRAHFFAIAARTMRHILTDYGRARRSQKRGGGVAPVALDEDRVASPASADIVDLDDALQKLAELDARKSDTLVLHFFGGMTYEETAEALNVSAATVDRDLRLAKAWLANELKDD